MERVKITRSLFVYAVAAIVIFGFGRLFSLELKLFSFSIVIIITTLIDILKWHKMDSILFKLERQPEQKIATIGKDIPAVITGNIFSEKPLLSKYTKTPCVFYHSIREEYVQQGKHSKWVVKEDAIESTPFSIKDATGEIKINPHNIDSDLGDYEIRKNIDQKKSESNPYSEIDAELVIYQQEYSEPTGKFLIFNTSKQMRQTEYVLKPEQKVFVYGWTYYDNGEKYLAEHDRIPLIISRKSKEDFIDNFISSTSSIFTFNFLFLISAILIYFSINLAFNVGLWLLFILVFIILIRVIVQVYNKIIILENRVSNSIGQIEIELKKRLDLLPKIEQIVKKYSEYEKTIYTLINNARIELSKDIIFDKTLIALAERHPELKSNKNYMHLQHEISQIENNIAHYRSFYSKSALKYNSLISIFPISILALICRFKKVDYWKDEQNL